MFRFHAPDALPGFRVRLPDDVPGFNVGRGPFAQEPWPGTAEAPRNPIELGRPVESGVIPLWQSAGLLFPPATDPSSAGIKDENVQPAKDPLRCSGPNSTCELPLKKRAFGTFRDHEVPPFRLCPNCYQRRYGTPSGDDT
jgi:hypothetical protein